MLAHALLALLGLHLCRITCSTFANSISNGTGSYAKAESLAGRAFQNPFFDVLWQTLLYQLNGALIGTEI